jgi:hypothetical protein
MILVLSLFLVALPLLGCSDMGIEPKSFTGSPTDVVMGAVPGVVGVIFTSGTTVEKAERLVKELNLEFQFPPRGNPVNGIVAVPVGSEDEWVIRLKTYAIVESVDRVWFTLIS